MDHWLNTSSPPWKPGLVIAIAAMAGGAALVVVLPEILAASFAPINGYSPAEKTDWVDSARTGLLGVIAFGVVAAWVTHYRQSELARTTDAYTDNVRQLSMSTWEQAAAIRDLEGIAATRRDLRVKTLQMLAVFIRQSAPRNEALQSVSTAKPDNRGPTGKRRPDPGVQEALRVVATRLTEWAPQPRATKEDIIDASEDSPDGVPSVGGPPHPQAEPSSEDAYLSLADIAADGAFLRDAHLRGVNLRRSLMRDVKLERADLTNARLREAVLSDADLRHANLTGASMARARLNRADLRGASMHNTILRRADVSGAHLAGATGLVDQLDEAVGSPHCMPDSVCGEVSGLSREQ